MPIVNDRYVAPTWRNNTEPAIDEDELQAMSDTLVRLQNESSAKPVILNLTINAANWVGSAAPYTYALTANGVAVNSVQFITFGTGATSDSVEAMQNAIIVDNGQAANRINLKALGEKPTVNVPVRVVIMGQTSGSAGATIPNFGGGGTGGGFLVSATEPTDTDVIWFDSAHDYAVKVYNGTDWVLGSGAWGA